jgi:hypothetical protein
MLSVRVHHLRRLFTNRRRCRCRGCLAVPYRALLLAIPLPSGTSSSFMEMCPRTDPHPRRDEPRSSKLSS